MEYEDNIVILQTRNPLLAQDKPGNRISFAAAQAWADRFDDEIFRALSGEKPKEVIYGGD